MKALVVPCRRNGLGVIRSLGTNKVKIIGVDYSRLQPGLHSRYVDAKYVISSPFSDEHEFIKEIIRIGQIHSANGKVFLYPVGDTAVWALCKNWTLLDKYFLPVFETDRNILTHCIYKTQMYKIAEKVGIPCPKTIYNPSKYRECRDLKFPIIIKPYNSYFPDSIKYKLRKGYICDSHEQLENILISFSNLRIPFIAQDFITGSDDQLYAIGLFALRGRISAFFTGKKIRQFPNTVGECSFGEAVYEPILKRYAEQFISELKYSGIAYIEFKKNHGVFYFIEINARSWSWNSLATFFGVNLPLIGMRTIANDKPPKRIEQHRFSGTWIYFCQDFIHNVIRNRNIGFVRCLNDFFSADCHAIWNLSDPLPSFRFLIYLLRLLLGRALGMTPLGPF